MAAAVFGRLVENGLQIGSTLSVRTICCSVVSRAGQEWRIKHGLPAAGTEYGPLTDLPDWSFVDGRPAPLWKGQVRRKAEREEFARRIVMLSKEVDRGMLTWEQKQQQLVETQEEKQRNLLKAKGDLLRHKTAK
ncbi:large ribosomal subunit protein mL52 [Ambystoma mexicanum]|uniref:large ribosomal subunit protein mL52 n=1 Tax=Ambystoma mexicanum TaxID=8296 RepID=UPI0037E8882E